MTSFTAPFNLYGPWDTQTTVMSVDASGTAQFAGLEGITGSLTVTGEVQASSSATFTERIQVGQAGSRGSVTLVQRATIAANTTAGAPAKILLPSGADILDFFVDVEIPFETAAGATAAAIRGSVAGGAALFEMAVSASTTRYGLQQANTTTFLGSSLRNITATIEAHVSVQASPSAMTDGQAMLSVIYVVN